MSGRLDLVAPADAAPNPWAGFVDDAAVFPPGEAPLDDALAAYATRDTADAALVGGFVLRDTDLPRARGFAGPLSVVLTGGAGQVAGVVGLCARLGLRLGALEVALRDPDDLAGNVRRVVAAADAAGVEVPVFVEVPAPPGQAPTPAWLAAADEVAAAELRLKLRTGGLDADAFPPPAVLAAWIDAALDRETPFKCTAGLHRARRHLADDGFTHHGFGNVLLATQDAFDGASPDDVAAVLADPDPPLDRLEPARARRWFTSFGCCGVAEPIADLRALGMVTA
jgi:hypothetical protein